MSAVLEDAKTIKVDKWGTLNTAASPQRLPEGHSPDHQNVWVDEKPGSVITANGYSFLGTSPSDNPTTFLLHFFKTSDGSSQLILSDNETVWWTTDYVNYTQIVTGLSPYFQIRGTVVRDKVWLTNGSDPVMTWNGSTLATLDGTGGTPNVPLGKYIITHDERIFLFGINGDLSSVRFTALANSSGTVIEPDNALAWPSDNEIQISEGDADQGTGIFLYRGYLFCSKQYSIWRITGSDEYTYARVKTRSSTGTRFQESIQIKDNLVHFIGVDGFYVFDGEDSKRISDPIDPASSDAGVFAFRNLQQPLLNTRFWNVTSEANFNAGTVPANLETSNDELALIPADDSQSDFAAGTNSDTTHTDNPGNIQLALVTSGGTTENLALGRSASLVTGNTITQLGIPSYITDGAITNWVGWTNTSDNNQMRWIVDLGTSRPIGSATVKSLYIEDLASVNSLFISEVRIQYSNDNSNWTTIDSITLNGQLSGGARLFDAGTRVRYIAEADYTVSFATTNARYWRLYIVGNKGSYVLKELQFFRAGYKPTGTFTSKSIDYMTAPATFGTLAATITANGETYQFFTQSSNDGSTWDAAVNVSNGGAIGSTLRRYLRWGVTLNSSAGINTPVVDKVYVGGTYLSEIHDTGGNILQWGPFQAVRNAAGQTVTYYFRAASTSGGVSAASWTAIVTGAAPNTADTNTFIQIKIELSTTDATQAPVVSNYTVNWILSSASGASVLQNVASIIILNRYWLAAATLGATENDIVIVLGKSPAGSPWHKKDFAFLSFCKFNDIYIASSSVDGSLYRLEYGYSKNGSAMDSYYETQDYSADGFFLKGKELLVTHDRSGPYDLSVGYSLDGGLTYTDTTVGLTRDSGEALSVTTRLNINFMSDSVRFRVRTNAADQPFSVDDITCFYRLSPQRGSIL